MRRSIYGLLPLLSLAAVAAMQPHPPGMRLSPPVSTGDDPKKLEPVRFQPNRKQRRALARRQRRV